MPSFDMDQFEEQWGITGTTVSGGGYLYTNVGAFALDANGNPTGQPMTLDQVNAARTQQRWAEMDETLAWAQQYWPGLEFEMVGDRLYMRNPATGEAQYANGTNGEPPSRALIGRMAGEVSGQTNSTSSMIPDGSGNNPWYGTTENPGPLTVTPEFPNGGPMPGGNTGGGNTGGGNTGGVNDYLDRVRDAINTVREFDPADFNPTQRDWSNNVPGAVQNNRWVPWAEGPQWQGSAGQLEPNQTADAYQGQQALLQALAKNWG